MVSPEDVRKERVLLGKYFPEKLGMQFQKRLLSMSLNAMAKKIIIKYYKTHELTLNKKLLAIDRPSSIADLALTKKGSKGKEKLRQTTGRVL